MPKGGASWRDRVLCYSKRQLADLDGLELPFEEKDSVWPHKQPDTDRSAQPPAPPDAGPRQERGRAEDEAWGGPAPPAAEALDRELDAYMGKGEAEENGESEKASVEPAPGGPEAESREAPAPELAPAGAEAPAPARLGSQAAPSAPAPSEAPTTLMARENTDETISVPECNVVVAAFYGDAERSKGDDVTDIVKRLHAEGEDIRASNGLFGDPIHGTVKTLFVDVKATTPAAEEAKPTEAPAAAAEKAAQPAEAHLPAVEARRADAPAPAAEEAMPEAALPAPTVEAKPAEASDGAQDVHTEENGESQKALDNELDAYMGKGGAKDKSENEKALDSALDAYMARGEEKKGESQEADGEDESWGSWGAGGKRPAAEADGEDESWGSWGAGGKGPAAEADGNEQRWDRRGTNGRWPEEAPKARLQYREVDFSCNQLSGRGLAQVLDLCARCDGLQVVKLFRNRIDDACVGDLTKFLGQCRSLREVHLSHNRLSKAGVAEIVRAADETRPRGAEVLWLRLENNDIPDQAAFLRDMERRYSVCPRRPSCTQFTCGVGSRIHLPFFDTSRERWEKATGDYTRVLLRPAPGNDLPDARHPRRPSGSRSRSAGRPLALADGGGRSGGGARGAPDAEDGDHVAQARTPRRHGGFATRAARATLERHQEKSDKDCAAKLDDRSREILKIAKDIVKTKASRSTPRRRRRSRGDSEGGGGGDRVGRQEAAAAPPGAADRRARAAAERRGGLASPRRERPADQRGGARSEERRAAHAGVLDVRDRSRSRAGGREAKSRKAEGRRKSRRRPEVADRERLVREAVAEAGLADRERLLQEAALANREQLLRDTALAFMGRTSTPEKRQRPAAPPPPSPPERPKEARAQKAARRDRSGEAERRPRGGRAEGREEAEAGARAAAARRGRSEDSRERRAEGREERKRRKTQEAEAASEAPRPLTTARQLLQMADRRASETAGPPRAQRRSGDRERRRRRRSPSGASSPAGDGRAGPSIQDLKSRMARLLH